MAELGKIHKVKQCVDSLAEGLDPFTGQPLPKEDIVNDVRVSRCLFFVSALLQEQMRKKITGKKRAFWLSLEEREQVDFSKEPIPASKLAQRMNDAAHTEDCKKISYRQITDWLVETGMLEEVDTGMGARCKRPTAGGKRLGILVERRTGQKGPYLVVLYNENAQRFVVDNVDAIVAFSADKRA